MDPITLQIILAVASLAVSALLGGFSSPGASGPSGTRLEATDGGDEPLSFIVGRWATAGHEVYDGTWGGSGQTPNAYWTGVYAVSDLPIRGFARFAVYGEWVTLDSTPHADGRGYPVLEYRKGGKDYLWIKTHAGDQTVADSFLVAKFGSDADYPWTSDMVGRGVAYMVITALVNDELFSGRPQVLAEVDGVELDDPRGDDAQENAAVIIRQVLAGFSYDGEWVWGCQDVSAARLPSANWEAQMDKADAAISLDAGGSEARFRLGAEISVDQQPIDVLNDMLACCNGRMADIGGVYKLLLGEPDDPVVSFTDEDIVNTDAQQYVPFPSLDDTINAVVAKYVEPESGWITWSAPVLKDAALEADDDDRRLPTELQLPYVAWVTQAQRVQKAVLAEARRFREHAQTMPPNWWEYEPLDAVAWTSTRNGYTDKTFLIVSMDDLPTANQVVKLREQDAADYDWSAGADEQASVAVPIVIKRPEPVPMTGWNAAPATYTDSGSTARRPAIDVTFAGGLVNIAGVRIQVREGWGSNDTIWDSGEQAYDPADADPVTRRISWAGILPATSYGVRGRFRAANGQTADWSDWVSVTTVDVRILGADLDLINLGQGVLAQLGQVRTLVQQYNQLGTLLAATDLDHYTQRKSLARSLEVKLGDLEASFSEIVEVALGPGGAIATAIESLYAAMGGNTAAVNVFWEAQAAPAGYAARYAVTAEVNDGRRRAASMVLDVPEDPDEPTTVGFMGGRTVIYTEDGTPLVITDEIGVQRSANGRKTIDWITGAEVTVVS